MRLQKVLTGAGHLLFLLFVFPFPVYENSREAASYVLMLPYFDRRLLFPFQYDQGYWTLRQIHETCPVPENRVLVLLVAVIKTMLFDDHHPSK